MLQFYWYFRVLVVHAQGQFSGSFKLIRGKKCFSTHPNTQLHAVWQIPQLLLTPITQPRHPTNYFDLQQNYTGTCEYRNSAHFNINCTWIFTCDINLKRARSSISTVVNSFTDDVCLSDGKVGSWLRITNNTRHVSRIIWRFWAFPYNHGGIQAVMRIYGLVADAYDHWRLHIYGVRFFLKRFEILYSQRIH